jgi:hypothetical protein
MAALGRQHRGQVDALRIRNPATPRRLVLGALRERDARDERGRALLFLAVAKPLSLVSPKPTLAKTPLPVAVPTPVLTSGLQDMDAVGRSNTS